MASEFQLKQAAVDVLHGMLRTNKPKRFSAVKAQVAIDVLQEMREAKEDRLPPEWVQQLAAETALELARERRNKDKD